METSQAISRQRKTGLVHVLTGDGNGKTTSAIGIAVRAVGRGMNVVFVQFLKGGLSSEVAPLQQLGVNDGDRHQALPEAGRARVAAARKGLHGLLQGLLCRERRGQAACGRRVPARIRVLQVREDSTSWCWTRYSGQ